MEQKLEIFLNKKEAFFLKQYAQVFHDERREDSTADPIVCVEVLENIYNSRGKLIHTVYKPIAFFLTMKEAEAYCKYQAHNLNKPRVYSRYVGYGNDGDLECLMKMMRRIGSDLLAKDKEKVE